MKILNNKMKLVILIFLFVMSFFCIDSNYSTSLGIYRSTFNNELYLSILDPTTNFVVTLDPNDGSGTTSSVQKAYNEQMGNDLYTPTRANYNFLGWYDTNNNRVYSDVHITGTTTFHAEWKKIVCKKVTSASNLNTETCAGSNGCTSTGTGYTKYSPNNVITYGTIYGENSPISGDAFDCDIDNDDIYDETDEYGKHTQRFYFVKEKENQDSDNTAVLIYYTSYDSNGRVDTQHTIPNSNIGSSHYNVALSWLPTSSTTGWTNPGLIDFDSNNGKITRFLSIDELADVCGPINKNPASGNTVAGITYFTDCFNNPDADGPNWYLFENSRFQSSSLGRAGLWLGTDGTKYYRIQTSSLNATFYATISEGDNMARPVIEIPMSALDGFVNEEKYTIEFNTHGGTAISHIYKRFDGEELGNLPSTTKEHFTFDGWYATFENDTYSNPVTSSTVVHGDMTLHAKWTPKQTCTVTLELNEGTGLTSPVIVDIGETYDPGTPTKTDYTFEGWYTDSELNTPYDATVPISTSTLTLYAKWVHANYVAMVNGVGYDTLASAIVAVPTGTQSKTRVTILKDITLSESISIPSNKWVEIAGGNYTISGNVVLFSNSGKLDIYDGTYNASANYIINNQANSTLNILGGSLTVNKTDVEARVIFNNVASAITNISGGTLTNVSTKTGNIVENIGTLNITGGTLINNAQGSCINVKSNGILNISGGEIYGRNTTKGQAVYVEGGTVNISGNAYLENTSGDSESRGCVDSNGGTINITGGTIVSKNFSAVIARKSEATVVIGQDDGTIYISDPVLRGKEYGLNKTNNGAIIEVYDGIFESLNNSQAISTVSVTKPANINFKTDASVLVDGVSYHAAYLLAPSITINFYEETNGTAIPVVVDNGAAIGNDLPTPSPKQGYYFVGWFIDEDPLKPVTSATVVNGTFDAYAKWVQSVSDATFNKTMNIQINTTSQIVFEEDDIEDVTFVSSDTTVATVDSDGTVHAVGAGTATITITGATSGDTKTVDVTVVLVMRTVKFYDDDYNPNDLEHSTLINTLQIVSGTSFDANMPNSPTKANYVFTAWYIDGNSATPFTNETTVNGDMIVVANWKEKVNYATITTDSTPFKVFVGNTGQITLTPTNVGDEIEDYTFTSGNTNYATVNSTTGEVTGVAIGDTYITVTGSLSNETVQVPVSVDVLKYTVTFKDGENVIKSVLVQSGSTVGNEMPANQTKTNYIFNGWVYENNNTLTPFTSATQVLGDIDVIVSWKEQINIATLPDDPTTITLGGSKQILVTATGEGGLVEDYTLASSNTNYVEVSGKTIIGSSVGSVTLTITGVESNISRTITVNVIDSYNVTFDPDNGETPTVIQVGIDSTIDASGESLPTNPTKTDMIFDDWYLYDETNEILTTTRLDTSATVSSNITYKAKWVSNIYKAVVYGATTSYHETLQDAFDAVPTTGTETEVKLLQDIVNPSGAPTVADGRSVILNGGSHSVTAGSATVQRMLYVSGASRLRIVSGTYSCGINKLATIENAAGCRLYIDGGLIENTLNRAAIYNSGYTEITGGTLTSVATERAVVQNAGGSSTLKMTGGTVNQLVASSLGALHNEKAGARITITGGTVTSVGNAIKIITGTYLTVGTQNNTYDTTSPIIQGDLYGINADADYSVYDGIIKGKSSNQAVNDFTMITGYETGMTRLTGTDGAYYTLYYDVPNLKYHIDFNANDGEVTPASKEFDLNSPITTSDLPTPTRNNYIFDGWYTDSALQTPFATFTPTTAASVTYYAKWTFNSSLTPVSHNVLSNAMQDYFTNVSSWEATDVTDPSNEPPQTVPPQTRAASANYDNGHHLFKSSISQVFNNNGCSACGADNACNSPSAGVYCDQPGGYDSGLTDDLDVYLYENGVKSQNTVSYITSTGGKIYNMIPGETYYWESANDNTKYGVVTATGARRTLKTSIRNLRDLGGLSASNTDVSGTIDYGRLYRGAQITTAQGVTDLTKLGITREVDLRGNGDGNQTYKMSNYDTGTSSSYTDIIITNYIVNPVPTTYILSDQNLANYRAVKSAMRKIMEKVVFNHDSIFFHCTIGTDRTGTMAYFLEDY